MSVGLLLGLVIGFTLGAVFIFLLACRGMKGPVG